MQPAVLIVGGGLAGLAAAAGLAGRGLRVVLLESRNRLGGRASSFIDQTTGEEVDNCQHVVMGCCTAFKKLMHTVGLDDCFRDEPRLNFVGPDGQVNRFRASPLPAPLHLLPAFRRLSYLSPADRRALSRGLQSLARTRDPDDLDQTFSTWLERNCQPQSVVDRFWNVVLVSALSETPDRVGVAQARKVFVDGFLSHRRAWLMSVPTVPLSRLYGDRLTAWLRDRGADVRLQTGVAQLVGDAAGIRGVQLRDGSVLEAGHVVLAVPHHRVSDLLPPGLILPELAQLSRFESAPISSVHFWFDREVIPLPHAVLIDRLSQWVFNRSALQTAAEPQPAAGHYYQVVISASRMLAGQPAAETISRVRDELAAIWPEVGRAECRHARLVTEHRAVFSPLPGSDAWRPRQQSSVHNLQFAGDWTRTGWPATMEGAVRSGWLAVENILQQIGRSDRLVPPELAPGLLSRLLLGL